MPRGKRKSSKIHITPTVYGEDVSGKPEFFMTAAEKGENTLLASLDHPNRLQMGSNGGGAVAWERYEQIHKGIMPFNMVTHGDSSFLDIQQIVELCQKAYFNVSIFRNTIDIMTEFSNSQVMFKGGNEKSRKFFDNWYHKKIGGYSFADQFFREWFRSGNVFFYRFDADLDIETLRKLGTVYGSESEKSKLTLPIKYLLINPAFLRVGFGLNFSEQTYYKLLTNYEIGKIKNPITEAEKDFANSLGKEMKKAINSGDAALIALDLNKTYTIFCKKQDYEPFSMPLFFPVLEDIDLKLQFKRIEKTITRTVDLVQLLINVGTEEIPNPKAMDAMRELYRSESIGRVLIADGTTKAQFLIPDLNSILGPEKYQNVNQDIANGLMNIFYGEEKFSGASIKIKVFMERLNEARRAFLEVFLNPEIRRISKELGFRQPPIATMASLDISDAVQTNKIYLQLLQLGAITPEATIEAINTGYLPTSDENLESQKKFKDYHKEELYLPLLGGGAFGQDAGGENGRPTGTKGSPQTTQKPSPAGTSKASEDEAKKLSGFSINKIVENFQKTNELYANLAKEAKSHFKIKKLNKKQEEMINNIMTLIVSNESPEKWIEKCKEYIKNPQGINLELGGEIDELMAKYDVSSFLGGVLLHSKV